MAIFSIYVKFLGCINSERAPGDMASPRSNDVVILPSRHPPSAEVLGSPVPFWSPARTPTWGEKVGKKNPMDSNSAGNGRGIWLLVPKGGYCIFCWMFFLLCCRQMTNMTMSYSLLLESWKSTQFQWTMFLDFDFQGMDILNITHDDIMMTPNTLLFPGCIWLGRKDEYLQPMGRFLPASTGSTRSTSATVLLYPPNKYSQNMV